MCKKRLKAAFCNLGCKVNAYETDAMAQSLREAGYETVPFQPGADVYIINTCTVTNIADRKSRQMLHRAKKMNPTAIVAAVGCYAQIKGDELIKDSSVDIIIGNNQKSRLADILEEYRKNPEEKLKVTEKLNSGCEYEYMKKACVHEHTRAFLKIQDGCNQFCTYCIIPYSRGRIRSREMQDIKDEAAALAANGYREVVLNGIHLSSYGKDFSDKKNLSDVIEELGKIEGIDRIRLGSLEQGIITEEFLERVSRVREFCPHFHLSLQSGCEETLKRMNRHYTPFEYMEKCRLIRSYYKDAAITTDVIVGFPGETDEEFSRTREFLKEVSFADMHIFKYSKRKGTAAAMMEGQLEERIKAERSEELISLGHALRKNYMQGFIGKKLDILFEEKRIINGQEFFEGHTREYVKAAVKTDRQLSGEIADVKIQSLLSTEINEEILLAQLDKI